MDMYLFFNKVTAFDNAQFTAISESFDACKKKSPECFFIHFLSSSPVENLSMEVLLQIWKQFWAECLP